ncbi:hypothetical protein HDA41_007379 [Streptomyces caelestis]|jgi:hypothetical protein|uniref:Uncharacterized protein n=1 Tax=Streptomyces caelestis TaxID=36816 RepID=A0A7W9HBW3_9ACTN|nr:hypothetical protein [Streptomyces caelestis]
MGTLRGVLAGAAFKQVWKQLGHDVPAGVLVAWLTSVRTTALAR